MALTSITLPTTVKVIGDGAFDGCTGLTVAELPEGTTMVGFSVFYECTGLRTVKLPSTITSIGFEAFAGCPSITSVVSLSTTAPMLSESAFDETVYNTAELLVPDGSVDTYKTSDGWKLFKNIQVNNPSAIDNCADAALQVVVDGNRIRIEGAADNQPVEVYSLGGQLVYRGEASNIELPGSGMYLVKVARQTVKVVL